MSQREWVMNQSEHTCPHCDGRTWVEAMSYTGPVAVPCELCVGTGMVWPEQEDEMMIGATE